MHNAMKPDCTRAGCDIAQLAATFRLLGEPTRLQLLRSLGMGECTVGELAQRCGCSVANASRHLALLARHGLVLREMRGQRAWYRRTDSPADLLCEGACAHIRRHFERTVLPAGGVLNPA